MAETQIDCEVLIVGGGPAGLTLANELHRWDVPFRIVDKKAEPERYSKAANLWPRSQEVFAAIGVLERLLERSAPLHTFSLHGYGKLLGHIPMDRRPSPYGTPAFIGQNEVEHVLSLCLDEVGASVERRVTAVEITDHGGHAEAVLQHAGGERETVRARWLVSCEGGASLARKAAGLDFEPERLKNRFIRQIDARLRWSRPSLPGHASFFLKRDGYMGILPLPGGYHRMFVLSDDAGAPADRDPTLEEMQEILREVADDPAAELSDPVWFSHGHFNHGVAPGFRRNSILLAGDAGHMTLPIYGQGMNTGMQDVFNLGWKLAYVHRGWAPEALLDSYDAERRPVREGLNAEQTRVFHAIAKPNWLRRRVIYRFGAAVLFKGPAQYFVRRSSQLDVAYEGSPLNHDGGRGRSSVKAGERAPDAVLVEAVGLRPVSLFEAIYEERWTLLLFDGGRDDTGHAVTSAADVLASWPQVALRPVLAAPRTGGSVVAPGSLLDIDRFAHQAYGLEHPTLVLVRPDGYVAFRGAATEGARLGDYLRRHLTNVRFRETQSAA
ncbi:FAD-binding monooxygenase [Methylobacterium sp. WL64]|uniref:FAD-dependent monooxygenase n=1 Tax=Methylobacterium sp. WL64 TaxID=2603894 RepID=UPI0011CB7ADB|nr:FAD-dependent monooxygenase [Methylobacterium sp. WL64]TXN00174.1 FAD-binding monooxygenase [Methylobacterium sp. WL64]